MYRLKPVIFNLNYTLDCGQVFRWERDGDWWTGVVGDQVIRLSQDREKYWLIRNFLLSFFLVISVWMTTCLQSMKA